jgi:REase_AHJR-like
LTTQDHQRAVQARILERARELQRQGFAVQVEPDPQQVPAFLRSFSVDLIAEREGEGLVLEVKAGHELQRPPYLEELARAVEQQPGWRFELELVEPEWADRPLREASSSSPLTYVRKLLDAIPELGARDVNAAVVAVWAPIEVLLERAAVVFDVPVTDQSAPYLMKALYTEGVLAREDFQQLQHGWQYRNMIAHGVPGNFSVSSADVLKNLVAFARSLLEKLESQGAE